MAQSVKIIGAGPSGLSAACALANKGIATTVIDSQSHDELADPKIDGRDIAMTHMSKSILTSWGVWPRFDPSEVFDLNNAKVQTQDFDRVLQFNHTKNPSRPLGFLVSNHHIRKALYDQACETDNIQFCLGSKVRHVRSSIEYAEVTLECGKKLTAQLLVAADSRFSLARKMMGNRASMTDYGRVMLVCKMRHTKSHKNTARESFLYGLTCATLPLEEKTSSVIVTVPEGLSQQLKELSDKKFNLKMTDIFKDHLGTMTLTGERFTYPLIGVYSDRFIGQRFALVGDAAVGMHPVTAHGYNLAVRSADTLATCVKSSSSKSGDIGAKQGLQYYELRHQVLAKPLFNGTNAVVSLFTNDHPIAKVARKAAIIAGDYLPGFKRHIEYRLTQTR